MATIAFIGLGNMGLPMTANLVKAGHRVQAFDLQSEAVSRAADLGAAPANTVVAAVKNATLVISMLQQGQQVSRLYTGNDGLFGHLAPGSLVIDCSTIEAETAQNLATVAAGHGLDFVDAPVSGGVAGAEAGTLTFIVGGSEEQFTQARPVLAQMGQKVLHAGSHGAGQIAKACNNLLLAAQMAASCEALSLGLDHGLKADVLSEIIHQSSGNNWVMEHYNPVPGVMASAPASQHYQGGFQVKLMCKDLNLAMSLSQASGSPVPMGSAARALFSLHQVAGNGSLDFSSLFYLYRQQKAGG
ncbi:3-hydroxyisobutyrate dehydrogenase [Oceanimonas baumannii]|uniref:3-hydroxyisobutyrate dehydrogenase n=1 Tax=Oceanimonas baumannii TaxID=129578 RepID=A0A235CN58_9GAMM|nr:3-hydroxyisobutyrate dehydrogenase [Oceanimonas baumannii]OYD25457.1 3-hydroxyisobutyrate dehydrogenase [Oceanimonas baumannii]TDW61345.1 3-hydroxyisobutyrate dehydrogenase [Oceanimonas baumannii]